MPVTFSSIAFAAVMQIASPALAHDPGAESTVPHAKDTVATKALGEAVPDAGATPLAQALTEPTSATPRAIGGRIGKVCQNKGCWMTLHDGDAMVRVETGYRFTIPADAKGEAVVLGTLKKAELDEDRAAHLRSESLDVAAGEGWVIEAMGVRILQ